MSVARGAPPGWKPAERSARALRLACSQPSASSGRCLPFDAVAAVAYAEIVATRTRHGSPISVEDAQIAAIARAGGLSLATRNIRDFSGIEGLKVIAPWTG